MVEEKLDYQKLGFKSGLEIHQQLDSHKLYCNCPSLLRKDEPDFEIKRNWKDRVKYLPHYWWRRMSDSYYNRKYSIQRLFKGYGDVDIFSFYSEISKVILPRLIRFRNKLNVFP